MAAKTRDEITAELLKKVRQDASLKQEFSANPKAVIKKVLDIDIPESVGITVLEETVNKRYIVIPLEATDPDAELTDEMLDMVAGGITVAILTDFK